jgi:hypothetical protein
MSFTRFERDGIVTILPSELAVLLVGVVARQAASPTAMAQAAIVAGGMGQEWLRPRDGAFSGQVAASLTGWKGQ